MSRGAWRHSALTRNSKGIIDFCDQFDLEWEEMNGLYQIRIEGVMDIYPVRKKYHWLPDGSRGDWVNLPNLRNIMIKKLGTIINGGKKI